MTENFDKSKPADVTESADKASLSKVNKPASQTAAVNKDPLHGITLKMMLEELHQSLGWGGLHEKININCFKSNPSIKSSLTFLRRTPWAREKLENLYLKSKGHKPARKPQQGSTHKQSSGPSGNTKKSPGTNPWQNLKR